MSDDGDFCICIIGLAILTFIVMTFGSPIFILYGCFSTYWLIHNKDSSNETTYGLYKQCQQGQCTSEGCCSWRKNLKQTEEAQPKFSRKIRSQNNMDTKDRVIDDTAYGLMVTSVLCLFLSILALPWLKSCYPYNKCLKYWNYCFLPLLLISAILSLSASLYFKNKYESDDENITLGPSQVCAGLGGGFQIVLVVVIAGIIIHYDGCGGGGSSSTAVATTNYGPPSTAAKTESYIVSIFYYESSATQAAVVQVQEYQQERY